MESQKENIEKLITFEKEKLEENMEMTNENLEYLKEYKEMFKDEEMGKLVRKEETKQKEKP
jgi:hypothetical protein